MATFVLSTIFAIVIFAAVIAFFLRVMILDDRSAPGAKVDTGAGVGLHPTGTGATVAGSDARPAPARTAERLYASRAA
jgi:hypothetical protein